MPTKAKPIEPGEEFGEWTVEAYVGHRKFGRSVVKMYRCRCSCGIIKEVNGYNLQRGLSNSCGRHSRHRPGEGHPLYNVWRVIHARSITKWMDFPQFVADVTERPKGKVFSRPDKSRPYGPDNWFWTTWNKANTHEHVPISDEEVSALKDRKRRCEMIRVLRARGAPLIQIGDILGITRERVRQLEARAC
jgi:hypothetical protein